MAEEMNEQRTLSLSLALIEANRNVFNVQFINNSFLYYTEIVRVKVIFGQRQSI